jgi:hypothetical protein
MSEEASVAKIPTLDPAEMDRLKTQAQHIETGITANITRLKDEADHNRSMAFSLRIVIAALSAITTVLVGISGKPIIGEQNAQYLSMLTLVVSATISVIAAWDAFFTFRDVWILFSQGIQDLYGLERELHYLEANGNLTGPRLDDIFKRFQGILDDTNRSWGRRRSSFRGHV